MDNTYNLTKTIEFLKGAKKYLLEVQEISDQELKLLHEVRDLQKSIQFHALWLDDKEENDGV